MQVLSPTHMYGLSCSLLLPHNLFTLSILYLYKCAPCTLIYPIPLLYNPLSYHFIFQHLTTAHCTA